MSFIIGRGRYARAAYPEANAIAGGAASAALRNRNVAAPVGVPPLTAPFTPATAPAASVVAALLFTPKVSGVVEAMTVMDLINGATAESYGMAIVIMAGTNLSITGGETTDHGWVIGTNTPPVPTGTGLTSVQVLGAATDDVAANATGSVTAVGISQPLPVGVPVIIQVSINEVGGGHALAGLAFTSLAALELP